MLKIWIEEKRVNKHQKKQSKIKMRAKNIGYSKDTCFRRFLIKCAYVTHMSGL